MQRRLPLLLVSCLLAAVGAGCGYDSNGPYSPSDTSNVAGSYTATLITSTRDSATTDLRASGLTFDMSLAGDGSMTGTYVITTGNERPGNPFAISGRWSRKDAMLTIADLQQTFVSRIHFVVLPGRLEGIGVVEQATIRMELERQTG